MKIYRLIIHCSATAADVDYPESQLAADHLERKISLPGGYHRYVRKDGRIVYMRDFSKKGAHAIPYNEDSLGFCYEGGLKAGGKTWRDAEDTRTEAQKASLLDCIYQGMNWILANAPGEQDVDYTIEIVGHGQLPGVKKECPSFDAGAEYAWITA